MLEILSEFTVSEAEQRIKSTWIQKLCMCLYATSYASGATVLALFLYHENEYNGPEFLLDVNHLTWETHLPAMSVCAPANTSAYSSAEVSSRVREFLKGLSSPRQQYCANCNTECDSCPRREYGRIVELMNPQCSSLFKTCTWNGDEFDCCDNFKLLKTKLGHCFTINSRQTERSPMSDTMVVRSLDKQSVVNLALHTYVEIYIHDTEDVGFISPKPPVRGPHPQGGLHTEISYRVRETRVAASTGRLSARRVPCALPGERELAFHSSYSRSACLAECRAEKQRAMCRCSHHLLPDHANASICNYEGLQCLDLHFRTKLKETKRHLRRMKLTCDCPPACEETEVSIIRQATRKTDDEEITATIELASPPTERLTMIARVSWLDLIVGIACFSRLFTSASLIGTYEALAETARIIGLRRQLRENRPELRKSREFADLRSELVCYY